MEGCRRVQSVLENRLENNAADACAICCEDLEIDNTDTSTTGGPTAIADALNCNYNVFINNCLTRYFHCFHKERLDLCVAKQRKQQRIRADEVRDGTLSADQANSPDLDQNKRLKVPRCPL